MGATCALIIMTIYAHVVELQHDLALDNKRGTARSFYEARLQHRHAANPCHSQQQQYSSQYGAARPTLVACIAVVRYPQLAKLAIPHLASRLPWRCYVLRARHRARGWLPASPRTQSAGPALHGRVTAVCSLARVVVWEFFKHTLLSARPYCIIFSSVSPAAAPLCGDLLSIL